MRAVIFIVLVTAARAFAQLPQEAACEVAVVRAPDDARATIEQILASEHCTTSLQVRVIPTTGGLYLIATDDHGRVRERVVPDATSAGVLIASWSADDGVAGSIAPPAPSPSTWQGPPRVPYGDTFHPPSSVVPEGVPEGALDGDDTDAGEPPPNVPRPKRFLAFGVGLGANSAYGIRAEVDVLAHAGWTVGLMGFLTGQTMRVDDPAKFQTLDAQVVDYGAAVTVRRIVRWADWHLRFGAGLGVLASTVNLDQVAYSATRVARGSGTAAALWAEGAVFLGHSIGETKKWELEIGPTASYAEETWDIADTMSTLTRQAGSFQVIAQLRRGL